MQVVGIREEDSGPREAMVSEAEEEGLTGMGLDGEGQGVRMGGRERGRGRERDVVQDPGEALVDSVEDTVMEEDLEEELMEVHLVLSSCIVFLPRTVVYRLM